MADWEDILVVDVEADEERIKGARWQWNSTIAGAIADAELAMPLEVQPVGAGLRGFVPIPEVARKPLLGEDAKICITVSPWE